MRVAAGTLIMLLVFVEAGAFARHYNQSYIDLEQAADALEHGNMNAAIAHAQRAATTKPQDPQAQFMLGTMLIEAHRYADAIAPLTSTTRLRTNFGPAFVNLCVAQRELNLLTDALANCEHGAQLSPANAESWFSLGRVRYALHDFPGARDALAKAVALNPNGFDENLQYALMLISNGETSKAVPYLKKAHNLRPRDEGVTKFLTQTQGK
jgi:tetratricopeptide (TPR) repeat protein